MLSRSSFRIDSVLEDVGPLAEAVYELASEVLDPGEAGEVEIGLMEALNNVIEHGGRPGPIDVHVELWPGEIRLQVKDHAKPMPAGLFHSEQTIPDKTRSEDLEEISEGGRGIKLILSCMDSVEYTQLPDGNMLHMVRRLKGPAQSN